MSIRRLQLKATVDGRSNADSYLNSPGDAVLVTRGSPRWLVMSCPCGCGEVIPINLDPRSGPAWEYYDGAKRGLTVFPSVWRDTGCRSHFIIWYGRIFLFGGESEDGEFNVPPEVQQSLNSRVPKKLSEQLVHFREIARQLDAVPWDVEHVCRQLVRTGYAREGTGKQRGFFARAIESEEGARS